MTDYEKKLADSVRDAVGELAGGARIRLDSDGDPRLVRDLSQPIGEAMDVLFRCGWLESMANGGTFKLSATDEMGDGKLVAPHEWEN